MASDLGIRCLPMSNKKDLGLYALNKEITAQYIALIQRNESVQYW